MTVDVSRAIESIDVDMLVIVTLEFELMDDSIGFDNKWLTIGQLTTEVDISRERTKLFVVEYLLQAKLFGIDMSVEMALFINRHRHIHATGICLQLVVRLYAVDSLTLGVTSQVDITHSYQFLWNLYALALQIF